MSHQPVTNALGEYYSAVIETFDDLDTDRRTHYRLAQLALAIALIITVKPISTGVTAGVPPTSSPRARLVNDPTVVCGRFRPVSGGNPRRRAQSQPALPDGWSGGVGGASRMLCWLRYPGKAQVRSVHLGGGHADG